MTNAAETPRAALRRMLAEPDVLVLPGVYDALSASLARRSGFRGAYITGAGVSMSLMGHPDLGFTTLTRALSLRPARAAAGVGLRHGGHPLPPHRHGGAGDDPGPRQRRRADPDVDELSSPAALLDTVALTDWLAAADRFAAE